MGEDDERRSQGRTELVLQDEAVAMELPVDVALLLHLLKRVATHTYAHAHAQRLTIAFPGADP